jgi:Lon protease-like protein
MDARELAEVCRALPLFPLPRTVLLPGALLPLHVFEPRYRALVAHCLEERVPMGIATVRTGHDPDREEAPPLFPEVGVGEVVAHQPFPDGRSNIVLEFVGRIRIAEELPSPHPFRLVRGDIVRDDDEGAEQALAALRVLVLQLSMGAPAAADEARRLVQLEGMALVDALARRLLLEPDDQRAYLGEERAVARIALVEQRLADLMVPPSTVANA